MRLTKWALLFLVIMALGACRNKAIKGEGENGAFAKAKHTEGGVNINRIVESGELIVATISGPDTYFDYQGRGMGLQYALAEDFAATLGVAVRVELANDSVQLVNLLKKGNVDVIVYQLPSTFCKQHHITCAGASNGKRATSWAVREGEDDLSEALNNWYGEGVEVKAQKTENNWLHNRTVVHRKVRAPFISRERGIISTYDQYFKTAAQHTGWDWRLIAAQCYQESGFDPNAVSWAGASGLMQLMPNTAAQYGLTSSRLFEPEANVHTAAQHIRHLQAQFANIGDAEERVKFVLAAYNAGIGHIRDAQALARKHGGNMSRWDDVAYYVQHLSQPQYYRDPVVHYGYMIGSETYGYVQSIMNRWQQYGGNARNLTNPHGGNLPASVSTARGEGNGRMTPPHKRNRFSKEIKILSPEELKASMQQDE